MERLASLHTMEEWMTQMKYSPLRFGLMITTNSVRKYELSF